MDHFWKETLLGFEVHLSTLIMAWAGMLVILSLAWLSTRGLRVVPTKMQAFGEFWYDLCRSITMATAGKRGDGFLFFVGSLFLFILTCNLMGQLPLRLIHLPHGELIAATGDFNTTTALALSTLIFYFAYGIYKKGPAYFSHYIHPHWAFLPLNIVEDITRPGSLTLRLYFNILVGEILAMIALILVKPIAGLGLPVLVILLELFVAVVQSYIFAILSSVYITLLSEEHHHEHHDESEHHAQQAPLAA